MTVGRVPFGQSFYGEQQLVLLRLDPVRPRGFFAEMKKLADAVSKLGKLLEAGSGEVRLSS